MTIEQTHPLPKGCDIARYTGDMRVLAQYTVITDEFVIRHDWVGGTHQCRASGNLSPQDLEAAVREARQAAESKRRNP